MSSSFQLNDTFLYVITAFKTNLLSSQGKNAAANLQSLMLQLKNHEMVNGIEYYDSQQRKFSIDYSHKQPAKDTAAIENYHRIDNKRLSNLYRRENAFVRVQLTQDSLATFGKCLDFFEDGKLFSGVLTLFATGVGMFTLRWNVHNTDVSTICRCSRKTIVNDLGDAVENFIRHQFPMIFPSAEANFDKDIFTCSIVRDAGFSENRITDFIADNVEDCYSLYSGLDFRGEYINESTFEKFLDNNLSTRKDTFFALNFRNALIVESLWKRNNFTQKRIKREITPQEIASREEYNDLNYIIWLEILLYQRHLLDISYHALHDFSNAPIEKQSILEILNFHEQMSIWINNLQGSMTTIYDTYQEWMDYGREIMGIDTRYRMFNERIKCIDNSIQTRYNYEQVNKQNRLSAIGVGLSILALYFAGLEFLKNVFEIMQSRNVLPGLVKYQIEIYCLCFIIALGYFSATYIRRQKRQAKTT